MKNEFKNIEEAIRKSKDAWSYPSMPEGHEERFKAKLDLLPQAKTQVFRIQYFRYIGYAASLLILVFAGTWLFNRTQVDPLAQISPEMMQTKLFFNTVVEKEIRSLEKIENLDNREIIKDALRELDALEEDYKKIEKDFIDNNGDKRVINAMIQNYKFRIQLLEDVKANIERLNKNKNKKLNK